MTSIPIIGQYACYFALFFIYTGIAKLNSSNRVFNNKGILAKKASVLIGLHLTGAICLGLLPFLSFNKNILSVVFGRNFPNLVWACSFALLLWISSSAGLNAGKKMCIKYERFRMVSNKFLVVYFAVRVLFLCAYELFFRGTLLFTCMLAFGVVPAVLISTALTVLIHVFTDKREMLSCVPFGILLSALCITINAVWPAIVIHLALSLAYEIKPLHHLVTRLKPIK